MPAASFQLKAAYSRAWARNDTSRCLRSSDLGRPSSVLNGSPLRASVTSCERKPSASPDVANESLNVCPATTQRTR